MKKSVLILALAAVAVACNNAGRQQNTEETAVTEAAETTVQATDLFGAEWVLTELGGEAIVLDTSFNAVPHLIFDQESNRVAGNGGCNGFGANLEFTEDGNIGISDIAATQMACPNLDLEYRFFEALQSAKHYHVGGSTLMLHGENHEAVATLQLKESE